MQLLLICHEFPPVGGGAASATQALARCLAREHDVTVLTARVRSIPDAERRDGYAVTRVGPRRRAVFGASPVEMAAFAVTAARAAVRVADADRLDGCLAVQAMPSGWVARWLAYRRGVPYVLRLAGADVPGFLPERYGRLHRIAGWTSAITWTPALAVVANSPGLRDLAQRTAGPLGVKVDVIPNGVDTDVFVPRPAARPIDGPLAALFVGRLAHQKGLDVLVEAVRTRRQELEGRLTIDVIGDGEDGDTLRAMVGRYALAATVRFTRWLPREALVPRLQAADLFCLPSLEEGMSNALLEAMACALPVIATEVAGTVDVVDDGVQGFVVAPRDADALGAALVRAVRIGRAGLVPLGAAGRRRVMELAWDRTAHAYLRYFPKAIA